MNKKVIVIGGGLAGTEAAWHLANNDIKVELWEMRPNKLTPAHHTGDLAELVCSNSLRALSVENAAGLLKKEMEMLNSIVIKCAYESMVPAGGALAVDRSEFSGCITAKLEEHPNVVIMRREAKSIPDDGIVIVATGPLSSNSISEAISELTGDEKLYFYDAAAPIVTAESIDFSKVFRASRYGKGEPDYLNCPMNMEEYEVFYESLINAERHPLKEFEKEVHFEGCMPVEAMAKRGKQTLLFGPLKPVGLVDPNTNEQPYAVVQLRQDDKEGKLFNLVGFQTNLKWPEQKRVFSKIPGLENAEFVRYGVMHRNTFINSTKLLYPTLQFKSRENLLFAGQITGVEGYIESASTGIAAGINAGRLVKGKEPIIFPEQTTIGALCNYITTPKKNFQPMNINFGLLTSPKTKIKDKQERKKKLFETAVKTLEQFKSDNNL